MFTDVAVVGVPDPEWGEAVVACYPAGAPVVLPALAAQLGSLAAYKRPKRYVPVADWPRNAQGKLSRAALRAAALREST
jgi:O-succinylbenzoic acid--CoA ligase